MPRHKLVTTQRAQLDIDTTQVRRQVECLRSTKSARTSGHTDIYLVVCEELLATYPGLGGSENELVCADMVFYETPNGGAVWSASSIAWAGSLAHNNYNNNVSRITNNVLRRFLDPQPFAK